MPENQVCDRCSATIVQDSFRAKRPLVLALPGETDDESTFEQEQRILCSGCEQDLLAWIDGEFERENAVELPDVYSTGQTFRRFANQLENMADEMED